MNISKLFVLFSIIFCNISFSVGWGDILPSKLPNPPEIKVDIDFPAKQPVRPQSIYDPSIRKLISSSSSHHNRFQIVVKLPQPNNSWKPENFHAYFAYLLGNNPSATGNYYQKQRWLYCFMCIYRKRPGIYIQSI